MQRRIFFPIVAGLLCTQWSQAQPLEAEPEAKPHHTISAAQLQLLPAQNRVSAEMAVDAAGPALQRNHQGTFEVSFALQFRQMVPVQH